MKDHNYITIQGWMLNTLNLHDTELVLYAVIYGFSQDGNSTFDGSNKYLQSCTNKSESSVRRSLKSLIAKGYVGINTEVKNGVTFNSYYVKGGVSI